MSVINHMIVVKKEKEKISNEITRNDSISDEVINLALEMERSREVIVDNLMFDYLIREEEATTLMTICDKAKVNYDEISTMVQLESVDLLRKEIGTEPIYEMTWSDVANSLIRINKRLILLIVKKEYPDVYFKILGRAKDTADKIIGGIN